jgi:hypothetical protein
VRLENFFNPSYWLIAPTSEIGTRTAAVLITLALAWSLAHTLLARRVNLYVRWHRACALAGVIFAMHTLARLFDMSVLNVRAWWLVSVACVAIPLIQIARQKNIGLRWMWSEHARRTIAAALLIASFAWAIWTALTLRTHGVSGSDPYAYAQMGVDLATHGSVFHSFPLMRLTYDLNVDSHPVVHVGYLLPRDVQRVSTTVWPAAYSVFIGASYLVAGESGIYLLTPFLSLLSLCVVLALCRQIRADAYITAAIAVAWVATSYQQVEWQMTPMADIGAQLFSLLALWLSLRARDVRMAALGGIALGVAFDIRYTQVLIAPALAFALWTQPAAQKTNRRAALVVACAIGAFIAAMPTFAYHTVAFGSPLSIGSEEHGNFSLVRAPETLIRIVGELFTQNEFGLLLPLIALGAFVIWRLHRRALIAYVIYIAVLFFFHVTYAPLRLRDILSIFPLLYIFAAFGFWQIASWLAHSKMLFAGMAVLIMFLFWQRTVITLQLPITRGFGAFGYLVREQRASFDVIRDATPSDALIGCSLNSGAIDLHSQRLSFRPAEWNTHDATLFIKQAQREGRPIYLLDDGADMSSAIRALQDQFTMTEITRVDVPYYYRGGGSENRKVALYRLAAS